MYSASLMTLPDIRGGCRKHRFGELIWRKAGRPVTRKTHADCLPLWSNLVDAVPYHTGALYLEPFTTTRSLTHMQTRGHAHADEGNEARWLGVWQGGSDAFEVSF